VPEKSHKRDHSNTTTTTTTTHTTTIQRSIEGESHSWGAAEEQQGTVIF
jgi:hypothetical protein